MPDTLPEKPQEHTLTPKQLRWLSWAQQIQAISQAGLTYCTNPFDRARYAELRTLAAEILAEYTGMDESEMRSILDNQAGYATPKVDVRGVVIRSEKILLVKELADGLWTLPGRWVDVNDRPGSAVEREVREEAGCVVRARRLLALYDRNLHGHPPHMFHAYKLFFLCDLIGETEADPLETAEATFYGEDELPPLSIDRVTAKQIYRMFYLYRHPEAPTDFD